MVGGEVVGGVWAALIAGADGSVPVRPRGDGVPHSLTFGSAVLAACSVASSSAGYLMLPAACGAS
jgi:hypothetical protein